MLRQAGCVSVGDGRLGHSEDAPYDAIHVGAAAPTVPQAVSVSAHAHPRSPDTAETDPPPLLVLPPSSWTS